MEQSRTDSRTVDDQIVNYLPAAPAVTKTRGRIERFVQKLLSRRGELRPVVRDEN